MGVPPVKGNLADLTKLKYVFNSDVPFSIICLTDPLVCAWFFFLTALTDLRRSKIQDTPLPQYPTINKKKKKKEEEEPYSQSVKSM